MRILIAEDDTVARTMLAALLAKHGTCEAVADGVTAAAALEVALRAGRPYDLVCLDINMPGNTGLEVLAVLRALEKGADLPLGLGAKVVMTTSLGDAPHVMEAFRSNCDGYLVKPVAADKLRGLLTKLGLAA